MSYLKVGMVAALLCLAMAGTAAASCGDAAADAVCMAEDLLFGPSGLVPFTTQKVTVVWSVVEQILPAIFVPFGGWL